MPGEARAGFADGEYAVGRGHDEIRSGRYRTVGAVACYWGRSTGDGDIIDSQALPNAQGVRVTIAASDGGFTSHGCGAWIRNR